MLSRTESDWLARYQPWRRTAEVGFWLLVIGVQVLANSQVAWMDQRRTDPAFPFWPPLVWELTSNLVVLALIPAVLALDRRFPLQHPAWRRHLAVHLAGSVVFTLLHVAGMVLLRKWVYASIGQHYNEGPWLAMLRYEYLKDVRSYALFLVAFWSYRLFLLRLQGEARVLDAPDEAPGAAPPVPEIALSRPERFLVRKLRREFLIAANDIEWLQAQGNYIGLHVKGHDYLLRATLEGFLQQLDPARFARVHRSYAVNRDHIAEIEPLEAGDARLKMKDGTFVPCSRRYRDALAA